MSNYESFLCVYANIELVFLKKLETMMMIAAPAVAPADTGPETPSATHAPAAKSTPPAVAKNVLTVSA